MIKTKVTLTETLPGLWIRPQAYDLYDLGSPGSFPIEIVLFSDLIKHEKKVKTIFTSGIREKLKAARTLLILSYRYQHTHEDIF